MARRENSRFRRGRQEVIAKRQEEGNQFRPGRGSVPTPTISIPEPPQPDVGGGRVPNPPEVGPTTVGPSGAPGGPGQVGPVTTGGGGGLPPAPDAPTGAPGGGGGNTGIGGGQPMLPGDTGGGRDDVGIGGGEPMTTGDIPTGGGAPGGGGGGPTTAGGPPSTISGIRTQEITPENTLRGNRLLPPAPPGINENIRENARQLLTEGTNREENFRQQFNALLNQRQDQVQQQREDLIERQTAMGRRGSGMLNTSLGDFQQQVAQDRQQLAAEFAARMANQDASDRFRALQAGQNVSGMLQSQGLNRFEALRRERAHENQLAQQAMQNRSRRLQMLRQMGNAVDPTAAQRNFINAMTGNAQIRGQNAAAMARQQARSTGNFLNAGMGLMQLAGVGGLGGGSGTYIPPAPNPNVNVQPPNV